MPAEDGEIAEVTPMIVKVPKEPRDGAINNSALAGLLAQGGEKLERREVRRYEIIFDDVETMGSLGRRHGRSQDGIKTDGDAVNLDLLQWLMDEVHVEMGHGACTAVEVPEVGILCRNSTNIRPLVAGGRSARQGEQGRDNWMVRYRSVVELPIT